MGNGRKKISPWMFKKEIFVLYYGLQDKEAGLGPKLMTAIAILYLVSPIDLIPDFIPFFGYLDDIILVPLLLNLAVQWLPAGVREKSLIKATRKHRQWKWFGVLVILLLIAGLLGFIFLLRHLWAGH